MVLTSPSGEEFIDDVTARDLRADEFPGLVLAENLFEWFPFPTAELGRYTALASQADLEASTPFVVILPDAPDVDVEPRAGPPGTSFVIGVAGFEQGSEFPLHIYWANPDDEKVSANEYNGSLYFSGRYRYITSLRITADDLGRAAYDLETQASDPAGGYCLFTHSPGSDEIFCDASFELVPPR
jgi:hypothetical protein